MDIVGSTRTRSTCSIMSGSPLTSIIQTRSRPCYR